MGFSTVNCQYGVLATCSQLEPRIQSSTHSTIADQATTWLLRQQFNVPRLTCWSARHRTRNGLPFVAVPSLSNQPGATRQANQATHPNSRWHAYWLLRTTGPFAPSERCTVGTAGKPPIYGGRKNQGEPFHQRHTQLKLERTAAKEPCSLGPISGGSPRFRAPPSLEPQTPHEPRERWQHQERMDFKKGQTGPTSSQLPSSDPVLGPLNAKAVCSQIRLLVLDLFVRLNQDPPAFPLQGATSKLALSGLPVITSGDRILSAVHFATRKPGKDAECFVLVGARRDKWEIRSGQYREPLPDVANELASLKLGTSQPKGKVPVTKRRGHRWEPGHLDSKRASEPRWVNPMPSAGAGRQGAGRKGPWTRAG